MNVVIHQGGRKMGPARRYGLHITAQIWFTAWRYHNRQLPSGLGQPGWLGHRDLCPIQWGDPCDCALPPRTTPCVCRYIPPRGSLIPNGSRFRINPRCVHHGDPARTPTPPACTCPGLGTHPDCRRHNTTPNEDGPDPIHDHPHNPYDLDEDERHA